MMLLASLTPFLFFAVFILLCLCVCICNVSFVGPKSSLRKQSAHLALAGTLPSSDGPEELYLESPTFKTGGSQSHEVTAGQGPSCGITVPTGGCVWGVGAAAPLGAARH